MYKIFFNERLILLAASPEGMSDETLLFPFADQNDLRQRIQWFENQKINQICIFHHDLDALRKAFFDCFVEVAAAGGVVYNTEGKVLVIRRRETWDLPKGKADAGETIEQTALREVTEECGISPLSITKSLTKTYHTYHEKGKHIIKTTHWFVMTYTGNEKVVPQAEENITDAIWVEKQNIPQIMENTYLSLIDVFASIIY
jgi:8-oxo-dGTP pyrophosphatase MutT (NUDIX family)